MRRLSYSRYAERARPIRPIMASFYSIGNFIFLRYISCQALTSMLNFIRYQLLKCDAHTIDCGIEPLIAMMLSGFSFVSAHTSLLINDFSAAQILLAILTLRVNEAHA